jgi:hypothetical protein
LTSPSHRQLGFALTLLLLAGCATGAFDVPDQAGPAFDAERFFAGRLEGVGSLSILLQRPRKMHVSTNGRLAADGTLVLRQHVEQEGKPARDRQWTIRSLGGGRYAGSLSDASGPVSGDSRGNRLHLTYPMRGGLRVDQWLTLAPDGLEARNRMIVRKLGVVVARLEETIRKES